MGQMQLMKYSDLVTLARDNRDGATWYDAAAIEIASVCEAAGWETDKFIAILAITSPRVSVCRNLRITLQYMATGQTFPNTMAMINDCIAHYLATGEIRGPKTGPFRCALLGDTSAIVLDTHMASLLGIKQSLFSRRDIRHRCYSVVRRVATAARLCPRDCQAALWTGYLRSIGRNPARFNVSQEYANLLAYGGEFPTTGAIAQRASVDGSYQRSLTY